MRINPLDGDLTFLGRVLGSLPVDVHIGKLLAMGFTFGVLEDCIIIGGFRDSVLRNRLKRLDIKEIKEVSL